MYLSLLPQIWFLEIPRATPHKAGKIKMGHQGIKNDSWDGNLSNCRKEQQKSFFYYYKGILNNFSKNVLNFSFGKLPFKKILYVIIYKSVS